MLASPFDAYLDRLGLEPEPPSADALHRIHRAHVERVPYETLWIHMGEQWTVDPRESVARIALEQRGGYCFHLNGAMSELLRELGYDVVRHVGGVHGPDGSGERDFTNHLVLTVRGLPTDANPDGNWYVDAGLGDALYEPLPLLAGEYAQGWMRFELTPTSGALGDWHFTHHPGGSFTGMAWREPAATMDAFAARNVELSTSPDSGFVRVLSVQRRDAEGVDILRGLVFQRVGADASTRTLTTPTELTDVLGDVFSLDVSACGPAANDALWARLRDAHEQWESTGAG
jgi:arylamine N-acetyltransferase